jgi:RNA polymerase sigma-32 factor
MSLLTHSAPDEARRAAALAKRAALTDEECERERANIKVEDFARLGMKLAHRHHRYAFDLLGGPDDVRQIALMGMIVARERWDPRAGAFPTYAAFYVRAALNEAIEAAQKRDGIAAQDRLSGRYFARRGRVLKRGRLQPHSFKLVSADAPVRTADGAEGAALLDSIAADGPTPEEALIEKQERESSFAPAGKVREAMALLDARERRILEGRYFCDPPVTLDNLAAEFSISRERIRQIENTALGRIQRVLNGLPIRKSGVEPSKAPRRLRKVKGKRRRAVLWERDAVTGKSKPIKWAMVDVVRWEEDSETKRARWREAKRRYEEKKRADAAAAAAPAISASPTEVS